MSKALEKSEKLPSVNLQSSKEFEILLTSSKIA